MSQSFIYACDALFEAEQSTYCSQMHLAQDALPAGTSQQTDAVSGGD